MKVFGVCFEFTCSHGEAHASVPRSTPLWLGGRWIDVLLWRCNRDASRVVKHIAPTVFQIAVAVTGDTGQQE